MKPCSGVADQAATQLARIQEKSGKDLESFDLLRTYGQTGAAELLLTNKNLFAAAETDYAKRLEAAKAGLGAKPAVDGENDAVARARFREAGIKLAEVYQFQKKWDRALATYQSLAEALPDDFSIRGIIAQLQERAEQYDEAIATHFAMIQRKRELNRLAGRDDKAKPREITPQPPKTRGGGDEWVWNNLNGGWYSRSNTQRYPVHDDYVAILRSYLDRKKTSKAAEVLRDLAREDLNTFRWMAYSMARLVDNYNLGAEGLPILRLLYSMDPEDSDVWETTRAPSWPPTSSTRRSGSSRRSSTSREIIVGIATRRRSS